jgi:hypothetical protein
MVSESIEAFDEYVRLRKEGTNDWEPNLLLELGYRFKEHRERNTALHAAALSSFARPAGEAIIQWYSPWFPRLSKAAREKWWSGLFFISSPEVATQIPDDRWGEAAAAFGEAVTFELKTRIFKPFGSTHIATIAAADDQWKRAVAGTETLGGMIGCLAQAKHGSSVPGKQLNIWLVKVPVFRQFIERTPQGQLKKLKAVRGKGQHEWGSTADEARQAFTESTRWLEALTADPPVG